MENTVKRTILPQNPHLKLKLISAFMAPLFLGACGSMSFGETLLDTAVVFSEANDIKRCYEGGGTHATCEEGRW